MTTSLSPVGLLMCVLPLYPFVYQAEWYILLLNNVILVLFLVLINTALDQVGLGWNSLVNDT